MDDKKSFSIWIDADSCPIQIRDLIIRFAKRLTIHVFFVANRIIPFEKNPLFHMIICENERDAADSYIIENILPNDLVITRDIPLAASLVGKKVVVLNDRGNIFTENNIQERLAVRNLNVHLFESGFFPEKTSHLGKKECNSFANAFDKEIQKKLKPIVN